MAELGHGASGCSRLGPIPSPVDIPSERGEEGMGPFPMAGRQPRSIHWAPPAPTCGQRDGGQSPQQPLSRGWPCLGSAGLGCVLQPLLQPLSSACARSLPDPGWNLPEEQEHAQALFHSRAQVSAAIPTWAGPGLTAQPSTAIGALDVTCLSLPCPSFSCRSFGNPSSPLSVKTPPSRPSRPWQTRTPITRRLVLPCWMCLWKVTPPDCSM